MFGLAHFDVTPLVYGIVIFIGLWSMWAKLTRGKFLAFGIVNRPGFCGGHLV